MAAQEVDNLSGGGEAAGQSGDLSPEGTAAAESFQENGDLPNTAESRSADVDYKNVAVVEALLFASSEPLSLEQLGGAAGLEEHEVRQSLAVIKERCSEESSGFELSQVAGKVQFRTKPEYAPYLRELKADAPRRLSAAALETLAVIAYRQPVVRSDIEKIRGVDATPTLKTLLERGLIKIMGHQSTVGQPALYGTTDEFLKLFSLNSLSELPTLRDLSEFEKDPGETEEKAPSGDADYGRETIAAERALPAEVAQ